MNVKYHVGLLQQIAAGVNKHKNVPAQCLRVTFRTDDDEYEFNLASALDVLANDLYWDERGDWSEAKIAMVESI